MSFIRCLPPKEKELALSLLPNNFRAKIILCTNRPLDFRLGNILAKEFQSKIVPLDDLNKIKAYIFSLIFPSYLIKSLFIKEEHNTGPKEMALEIQKNPITPPVIQSIISSVLDNNKKTIPNNDILFPGEQFVVEILSYMEEEYRNELLTQIEIYAMRMKNNNNHEEAEKVKKVLDRLVYLLMPFDTIQNLNGHLNVILMNINKKILAIALYIENSTSKFIKNNLSKVLKEDIEYYIKTMKQPTIIEIEEAKMKIMRQVKTFIANKKTTLTN